VIGICVGCGGRVVLELGRMRCTRCGQVWQPRFVTNHDTTSTMTDSKKIVTSRKRRFVPLRMVATKSPTPRAHPLACDEC